jgi:glycosyltransferase involved in cell wall biosynthesis
MGVAQGMDILIELADRLRERRDIGFLFVGRGSESRRLRDDAKRLGLDNIAVHDEVDPTEIAGLYAQCHVGIVALDRRHKTHNIPGKFLSYMQAGLPVLANINDGNDLVTLIERERVGKACSNHNLDTLERLTCELVDELELDSQVALRCRELSAKMFSPAAVVKQVLAALGRKHLPASAERHIPDNRRQNIDDIELQREEA